MSSCSTLQEALNRLRKRRHCYTGVKYAAGIFYVLLLCTTVVANTIAATLTGIFSNESRTSADSNDAGSGSSNQSSISGGFIGVLILNCFSAVFTVLMPFVCWCVKTNYENEEKTYNAIKKMRATHDETIDVPELPLDPPFPDESQNEEETLNL